MSKFTGVFRNIMGMFEQPTPSVVFCASSHPLRKMVTKSGLIDKRRLAESFSTVQQCVGKRYAICSEEVPHRFVKELRCLDPELLGNLTFDWGIS